MCPGASDEIGYSIKSMQAASSFTVVSVESRKMGGVEIKGGMGETDEKSHLYIIDIVKLGHAPSS